MRALKEKFPKQFQLAKQLTKFFGVGVVATALHYILLIVLVQFAQVQGWLATSIGYSCSAVLSFVLARNTIFYAEGPVLPAALRFALMVIIGGCLNTLVFTIFNQLVHYLVAQIIATGVVFFVNFLISKYWVFKRRSPGA